MLNHTSVNIVQRTAFIQNMFLDHKEILLKISNKTVSTKFPNIWILNSMYINDPRVIKEIIRDIRKYLKLNENENVIKICGI